LDPITEFAKMFKTRENTSAIGPQIGEVIESPPNIKITILNGSVLLDKENSIFSAHILSGYQRNITIPKTNSEGETSSTSVGNHGSHNHDVTQIGLTGNLSFNDTLEKGDKVIVLPSSSHQLYYIMDKAVVF